MSEIRLRAIARIGQISKELAKAQGTRTELPSTAAKKSTKAQQLSEAGLPVWEASRYEQLAAPDAQLAPAFDSAFENYFATA
jgi:hypothetical protein